MKRCEQKDKSKQKILSTALDLFITKGYAATRTVDIASTVEISEGLLFHYFGSKEKLYLALIDIALAGRNNSLKISTTMAIEYFEKLAEYIIENCSQNSLYAKLFVLMKYAENDLSLSNEIRTKIKGKQELDQSVLIIKNGQIQGTIKSGDPLALALAFWSSIHGVVENIALHPELPIPKSSWLVSILKK